MNKYQYHGSKGRECWLKYTLLSLFVRGMDCRSVSAAPPRALDATPLSARLLDLLSWTKWELGSEADTYYIDLNII